MVILSKDMDFFSRSLTEKNSPKIVHFRLGNQTLAELHGYLTKYWPLITKNLSSAKVIIAFPNKIEIIR